jgi:hypothetical protein
LPSPDRSGSFGTVLWTNCGARFQIPQRSEDLVYGGANPVEKPLTGCGEIDALRSPTQKHDAQTLLQQFDDPADGWRRNAKLFSRQTEMSILGNQFQGDQSVQRISIHFFTPENRATKVHTGSKVLGGASAGHCTRSLHSKLGTFLVRTTTVILWQNMADP